MKNKIEYGKVPTPGCVLIAWALVLLCIVVLLVTTCLCRWPMGW
jgi:hypothetical protein